MIIKNYELKKINKKNYNFYLLYGPNTGHIDETIDKSLKPELPNNIFTYEESEILNNIDNFKETVLNKSFFDNEKLIIINRASDKIHLIIKDIIEREIENISVIIKSGVLEKRSKLRNFFEKNKNLVVVPFYEDNYQSLFFITQNYFKEKKIKISNESISFIIERSSGNRINLYNELEKIYNYSRNKNSIKHENILKLTNLAENYDISTLVNECLAKNKKKTINILNENNISSEENIIILKTFLFKLKRLKKIKEDLNIKKNIEQVFSYQKPPIFWKEKDIIKQQIKAWSLDEIKTLINEIGDLELLIKKNFQLSNNLINNFILEKLNQPNNSI